MPTADRSFQMLLKALGADAHAIECKADTATFDRERRPAA
jgi:hypothetical protein